jgi:succinate dehydrogenase / fumarate reductase cytochrome b subunit
MTNKNKRDSSSQAASSGRLASVTQKFAMALSGLGLVGFVIVHLLGNLSLYRSDGTPFNTYANALHQLGGLLVAAEIGLLLVVLLHIFTGIALKKNHSVARPQNYKMWRSKGGPTPSNFSSRTMIFSGLVLLVFIAVHVWQFRFGASIDQGYTTQIHGEEARDLHRLVVETFKNPAWVGFYVFCMLLFGTHLRHGIWSAFQSLGLVSGGASRKLLSLSGLLGFILAVGFLFIPVYIYFFV